MAQPASQYNPPQDPIPWSVVVHKLNENNITGQAKVLRRRKQKIREALGPVWNIQPREVQQRVIDEVSVKPLPTIQYIVRVSKAQWAHNRYKVICGVPEDKIPKPQESAFHKPEFQQVQKDFEEIANAATTTPAALAALSREQDPHQFVKQRLVALQTALFRSWECLSEWQLQSAVVVVHRYRDLPTREAFVDEVEQEAHKPLPALLVNARRFVDSYEPGTAGRGSAEEWLKVIRSKLIEQDWDSLDEEQRKVVDEFVTALLRPANKPSDPSELPRSMAALVHEASVFHSSYQANPSYTFNPSMPAPGSHLRPSDRSRLSPPVVGPHSREKFRVLPPQEPRPEHTDPYTLRQVRPLDDSPDPSQRFEHSLPRRIITPRQATRYKTTVEDWCEGRAFK